MKPSHKILLITLMFGAFTALIVPAQDPGNRPQRPPTGGSPAGGPGGPGGPGGGGEGMGMGMRPPIPPIVTVLDANKDGVIDAQEIANAAAALKKLDKNGDGKLTAEEYLPPRPQGGGRGPSGPGGPGGPQTPPQQPQGRPQRTPSPN